MTATDNWTAGFDDPPQDVVTPTAVTPPVTSRVTPPVTPAVTLTVPCDVTPGDDERVTRDPIDAGDWQDVPASDPERDGGLADVLARLSALASGSKLLGGNSLAAELANPVPGTLRQHWHHVLAHPARPAGRYAGAAFITGHLLVTGPMKTTGKAMTIIGEAGKRVDRAGDSFTVAITVIILAVIVVTLVVIALGPLLSHL